MSKMPEIYEGYVSDEANVFKYYKAAKTEVHKKRLPTDILRMRRIYKDKPIDIGWFKRKTNLKKYIKVRIIVEYI